MDVCPLWALCCQAEVSAKDWSLVQRSPTECGVSVCDREASTMWRPWPTGRGRRAIKKLNRCSPISVIPPVLYTHPHPQITFIRRTSRCIWILWKHSNATSFVGKPWTEQYFHTVWIRGYRVIKQLSSQREFLDTMTLTLNNTLI